MVKVDFFSSPIGLGHVTRDISIVENLNEIPIKFITGGGAAQLLKNLGYTVEDRYNPVKFKVKDGILKNKMGWLWKYYKYYKECKIIAREIIEKDKPDLVISDEDFASLVVAQEMKIDTILITDILETHFTNGISSFIEKKMNKTMRDIIKQCNAVIMPETGSDYENIRMVDPIVRDTNTSREELREKYSFNKKTILVSIGGTDAGTFLIDKILDMPKRDDVEIVIVSGPSINKHEKIRDMGFVNNLHEIILASDLVISLAGKSTIDEADAYGTPGIFIPIKDHFEQEDNAKRKGYSFDDINRLEYLISEKLEQKRSHITKRRSSEKAADIIKNLINR